jgi:hypothetical protein
VWWCCAIEDREEVTAKANLDFLKSQQESKPDLVTLGAAWDSLGGASVEDVEKRKEEIK